MWCVYISVNLVLGLMTWFIICFCKFLPSLYVYAAHKRLWAAFSCKRACLSAFPKANKGQHEEGEVTARVLKCDKIEAKWKSEFFFFKKKGVIRFQQNMAPLGQRVKKTRVCCRERTRWYREGGDGWEKVTNPVWQNIETRKWERREGAFERVELKGSWRGLWKTCRRQRAERVHTGHPYLSGCNS